MYSDVTYIKAVFKRYEVEFSGSDFTSYPVENLMGSWRKRVDTLKWEVDNLVNQVHGFTTDNYTGCESFS